MERYLFKPIKKDLARKIVIITGPRQSGKTTLARSFSTNSEYFSFDYPEHRTMLTERSWDRKKGLVIFDELHKMEGWKSWLKGIYDVEGIPPSYLVTGSARMDMMRKAGDSLAGRFFSYRLHPLDIKETMGILSPEEAYKRLENYGGFPEPFLENSANFYGKWIRSHTDSILRQDLFDLEGVRDIRSIETLIELLRNRVGSPISAAKLANDLQRDPKTIRNWLRILEDLYVIFSLRPYHKNVARAILKEPKYYFYDTGMVSGDRGVKLENIVACALRKEIDRLADEDGVKADMHYLRNKDGKEVDFAVILPKEILIIETKLADSSLSPNLGLFGRMLGKCRRIQLVRDLDRARTYPDGSEVREAAAWLAKMEVASKFL